MLQISEDLKESLSYLSCERLTFHKENKDYIQSFSNDRNPQLPKILKASGWIEDATGLCDYYIIKNKDNDILFFFALRAGLVQELYDKDRIEACKTIFPLLNEYLNVSTSEERKQELSSQIIPLWRKYELSSDLILSAQEDIEKDKLIDRITDTNENTTQVWQTHPAIELAFFCQNTDSKEIIKGIGFQRHFGSAVFWYYIMPIINEVQRHIGCEFVYLFAADQKNRGKLMDYYNTNLHFEQTFFLNGIKPLADNNCFFMCQRVEKLREFQIDYLANFSFSNNPSVDV